MMNFNAGAWRPANNDARPMSAADDLVRRTLAQHGLMPDGARLAGIAGLPGANTARPAPAIPDGASFPRDTYAGHSGSRAYRTYVPASAGQGINGIVTMLHGCTQTPEDFATGTGMNALAERHSLIVIYPEQARGANAQTCWNWFSKGDQRRARGEPEIIAGMTKRAMAEYGVPRTQTFVAGLSAGAAMAVILGEAYPDVFAAVGAHSGLPFGAASDVPSAFAAMAGTAGAATARLKPSDMRTIVFHGTADQTVHPANGDIIADMAEASGIGASVRTTQTGQAGGRGFRRAIASGPDGDVRLEHWTVDGLGHAWSGGQPGGSYTDAAGPDASAEMIRFFMNANSQEILK